MMHYDAGSEGVRRCTRRPRSIKIGRYFSMVNLQAVNLEGVDLDKGATGAETAFIG